MRKPARRRAHLSSTIGELCGGQLTTIRPLWEVDFTILPDGGCEQVVINEGIGAVSQGQGLRTSPGRLERLVRLKELTGDTARLIVSIGALSTYQALICEMGNTCRIVLESPTVGDGLYLIEHPNWQEAIGQTKGQARQGGAIVLHHTHNTNDERIDEKCLDFLTAPERTHDD